MRDDDIFNVRRLTRRDGSLAARRWLVENRGFDADAAKTFVEPFVQPEDWGITNPNSPWFWVLLFSSLFISVCTIQAITGFSLDGDTYGLNFTNDTQETLVLCARDCDSSPTGPRQVEPGEYANVGGALGHPILWQVKDQEENILGCFIYDFDERPKIRERYVSQDLVPCP